MFQNCTLPGLFLCRNIPSRPVSLLAYRASPSFRRCTNSSRVYLPTTKVHLPFCPQTSCMRAGSDTSAVRQAVAFASESLESCMTPRCGTSDLRYAGGVPTDATILQMIRSISTWKSTVLEDTHSTPGAVSFVLAAHHSIGTCTDPTHRRRLCARKLSAIAAFSLNAMVG